MKLKGIGQVEVASPESKDAGQPSAPAPAAEPLHIRSLHPTDLRPLLEAIHADNTEAIAPTHVLEREGRIVGYGSAGKVRLIAGWTGPSVSDATSLAALRQLEQAAASAGAQLLMICAAADCRFKPFLKDEGWTEGKADVTVFFKRAKGK